MKPLPENFIAEKEKLPKPVPSSRPAGSGRRHDEPRSGDQRDRPAGAPARRFPAEAAGRRRQACRCGTPDG